MIRQVREAIFNKRRELRRAGTADPVLVVVFSRSGYSKLMRDREAQHRINPEVSHSAQYGRIDGYWITVDHYQEEDFRLAVGG